MDNYRREELVLWDLACALDPKLVRRIERTPDGCWLWMGTRRPSGYGLIGRNGRSRQAHRYAYELLVGTIPDGLVIDHLCRRPPCLNPLHLEPVTQQVNVHRGSSVAGRTHCPQGHLYAGDNLIRHGNHRQCRECQRNARNPEWRAAHDMRPARNRKTFTCGTQPGYFAHRTRGEKACDPCRLAHNAANAARGRKRRAERRSAA